MLDSRQLFGVEAIPQSEQAVGTGDGLSDSLVDARLVFVTVWVSDRLKL